MVIGGREHSNSFPIVSSFLSSLQFLQSMVRERYQGNASADLLVHFFGGGLAGITAASVTYPLDLVRTRLAAQVTIVIVDAATGGGNCYLFLVWDKK